MVGASEYKVLQTAKMCKLLSGLIELLNLIFYFQPQVPVFLLLE